MTTITKKDFEPVTVTAGEPHTAVVLAASSTVTISSATWTAPDQGVRSIGVSMEAGDAGAFAVRHFGKTLKKLADN